MRDEKEKVDAFMAALDHPYKDAIEVFRALIRAADPRVKEQIKWNAPSFFIEDHFATFRLHPAKEIQIVLHNGARPKVPDKTFVIDDPHGLLKWAASDRCIMTLQSSEHAREMQAAVMAIVRQWINQL